MYFHIHFRKMRQFRMKAYQSVPEDFCMKNVIFLSTCTLILTIERCVNFVQKCTSVPEDFRMKNLDFFFVHMYSQILFRKMRQFGTRMYQSDPEDFCMKNFNFFVYMYFQIHFRKMRQFRTRAYQSVPEDFRMKNFNFFCLHVQTAA